MLLKQIFVLLLNVHLCFSQKHGPRKGIRLDTLATKDYMQCTDRDKKNTIPMKVEQNAPALLFSYQIINNNTPDSDPMNYYDKVLKDVLFGPMTENTPATTTETDESSPVFIETLSFKEEKDILLHYPSGSIARSERFMNKVGVHMAQRELMHRGHCRLKITNDLLQTAINAYGILLFGSLEDILQLPSEYILNSARTISMMKIARERLATTWTVVKNGRDTIDIPYTVLEKYRPLFKYLRGQEIAKLNLSDERILTYIGTHAELNRHQMGIVANAYIKLNPKWSEPKHLNKLNNLLCGIPITYMRRINRNVYLQLTNQAFYHIRACDLLQKKFYLTFMTKSETLGKSYSWSARDVARLGLLLAEVEGQELSSITPEAISGISAQVMLAIPATNLKYFTEIQMRFLGLKPLNILTRRLKQFKEETRIRSSANAIISSLLYLISKYLAVCSGCMILL